MGFVCFGGIVGDIKIKTNSLFIYFFFFLISLSLSLPFLKIMSFSNILYEQRFHIILMFDQTL